MLCNVIIRFNIESFQIQVKKLLKLVIDLIKFDCKL